MSAQAMYRHRYGWRPKIHSVDGVGDFVADEMFGQLMRDDLFGQDDLDDFEVETPDPDAYMQDPAYLEWASQFEEAAPVTTEQQIEGILAITIDAFRAQLERWMPKVHSYDVRGGQTPEGQSYAQITLVTSDPSGLLRRGLEYAISVAAPRGVAVTATQGKTPDQVVYVFSRGVTPEEAEAYGSV